MTTTTCPHCDLETDADRLFCQACGKVREPADLRSIRVEPRFIGTASMNPKMQEFMYSPTNAGDPAIFDRP